MDNNLHVSALCYSDPVLAEAPVGVTFDGAGINISARMPIEKAEAFAGSLAKIIAQAKQAASDRADFHAFLASRAEPLSAALQLAAE